MPYTDAQRRMAGAELGRLRAGKKTRTGMSEQQLRHMAAKHEMAAKKKKGKR